MNKNPPVASRPISEIALEIALDWKNPFYGAKPYLDAMSDLNSINDNYGLDSGSEIVARFLCNANTYRGEVARKVKKELHAMLKG